MTELAEALELWIEAATEQADPVFVPWPGLTNLAEF